MARRVATGFAKRLTCYPLDGAISETLIKTQHIGPGQGVAADVRVSVRPACQTNRVTLEIPSRCRVKCPVEVVLHTRLAVGALTRQPEMMYALAAHWPALASQHHRDPFIPEPWSCLRQIANAHA